MVRNCPNTRHHFNCAIKLIPRITWAVVAIGLAASSLLAATATEPPAKVSSFEQLNQLLGPQAEQGWSAQIKGTVLCYDNDWGQLFVHDGKQARYFSPQTFATNLQAGQRVEIEGKTAFADGRAILTNLTLRVIGKGDLPPPLKRPIASLTNNLGDWVETGGYVRVADTTSGRLTLVMEDHGQSAVMFIMGPLIPSFAYKGLVGCRISISGINTSKVIRGRLEPASVMSPGVEQIKILEPRGTDPLKAAVLPIDSILTKELGPWTNEPVHINGVVINYRLPNYLEIKDATGSIQARVLHLGGIRLNGRIDLWGFLIVTPDGAILRDAFFELPPGASRKFVDADAHGSSALRSPNTLTKISEILNLDAARGVSRVPVRLRGVITYSDPEWRSAFLQDQTGGIYVEISQPDLRAGQLVELQGQTDAGGFAARIVNATARALGTTNLPVAVRSDLEDISTGRLDARWIEMQGIVRRVSLEWGHLMITATTPSGRFKVLVPGFSTPQVPADLVDALVDVKGACGSELNDRGQIAGVTLHVPSLEYVHVVEPVPANPFSVRAVPIGMVATFDAQRLNGRRVKVSGTVTFVEQNGTFFAQDASGAIRITPQGTNTVAMGDAIEVLGFPELREVAPVLVEGVCRVTGHHDRPQPKQLGAEVILGHADNDGQLVQIEAELLQRVSQSVRPRLLLQGGAITFAAIVKNAADAKKLSALEPGSVVRVAGVCAMQGGESHEPVSFRLLVDSATDVALIRQAPWWTARHALMVAGGLSLAIAASLGWVRSLRRQVRRQTELIRQKLEERNQFAASLEREKAELAATQEKLVEASRRAGMADVATSVLHNVGNVLNSLNVSADLIARSLKGSKTASVKKLATLVMENQADLPTFFGKDGKGQEVPSYLARLSAHLDHEQQAVLGELELLQKNVDHVKEIVAMQQDYAKSSGLHEPHAVKDLLEDALRMNEGALDRHEVQVTREIDPALPSLNVDKHKFLQILINLLQNAKYACDESGRSDKRVTLRAFNGNGSVKISVTDNGIGIPAENMTRIFNHGFTTRKDGHGFGLHSSAIAARELGGRLFAGSDGPGKGATFTLDLPVTNQN
jgi:signal transduction histidine kinase